MADENLTRNEFNQFVRSYDTSMQDLKVNIKELEVSNRQQIVDITSRLNILQKSVDRSGIDVWKLIATGMSSAIAGYIANILQHIFIK